MCRICDFVSNWKNGPDTNLTRKHSNMEQMDGNDSKVEEDFYDSFHVSLRVFKGFLGSPVVCDETC